jgi:quercetin dioxygenase-like cupin family protein
MVFGIVAAVSFRPAPTAKGVIGMSHFTLSRGLVLAAIVASASASVIALPAFAGECPTDQKKPDAREMVDVKPVGVTDTVIAMIDVDKQQNIKDRKFRMRKLTIEPGGVVPWHSHGERPAIIYIIEGEINEYASNCAVPIAHKAGDVVAETSEVSHWWKNLSDGTVVLLSADILKDPNDHTM